MSSQTCDGSSFSRSDVARRDKVRESERHRLVGFDKFIQITIYNIYIYRLGGALSLRCSRRSYWLTGYGRSGRVTIIGRSVTWLR